MTVATGEHVLTKDAVVAMDAGADNAEFRDGCGLVWNVTRWQDPHTGEIDDLLHVVHPQHARLNWSTTVAGDVGQHARLGRLECSTYIVLCGREIVKRGGKTDQRIFDLLRVVVDVLREPRSQLDGPSVLDTADAARADQPDLEESYRRMQADINRRRAERGDKPIGSNREQTHA